VGAPKVVKALWFLGTSRSGVTLGTTLFLVGALRYRSFAHRPVLERWSVGYAAVLTMLAVVWVLLVITAIRAGSVGPRPRAVSATQVLANGAALIWGLGYLLVALDNRQDAGQFVDGNFFGSAVPAAVLLHGLAIVLLVAALVLSRWWRESRFANPALAAITVVTVLALGECGARAVAVVFPATQGFPTYSAALWKRRYVQLNMEGFRDTEHRPGRVPGVRRLLLVGDSYGFGEGIRLPADRLGERVVAFLDLSTGGSWELVNASLGDSHTLDEIGFLRRSLRYEPDVVVLVYVFNDIDYLSPATARGGILTEAPRSLWQRYAPSRLAYWNSFLFQAVYVRLRALGYLHRQRDLELSDPYADSVLVATHLRDLQRFVAIAESAKAVVGIVPFDVAVAGSASARQRYERFVRWGVRAGLPIWSVGEAFNGRNLRDLRVNALDGHPNELANALAAAAARPYLKQATGR
jgi:hypothetical protein